MLAAGSGAGKLSIAAKLAAWAPKPRQTVMAHVIIKTAGATVAVTLKKRGNSSALAVIVIEAGGLRHQLSWAGTRHVSLVGPLSVTIATPLRVNIVTPQLVLAVTQVRGGGPPATGSSAAPAPVALAANASPQPKGAMMYPHQPCASLPHCLQGIWKKSTAGYLNLGISAQPGLPAPVTGILAPSYKKVAPVLVARAKAAGRRPHATASIVSLLT